MTIAVSKIGHLVLRVSDLRRSLAFYELLGLHEVARRDFGEGPMAFLSTGNAHHDLALVEANVPPGGALHHFALKVGDSLTCEPRSTPRDSPCTWPWTTG